jgi:hypothetical protein
MLSNFQPHPSLLVLFDVLWDTEKKLEKEIKGALYSRIISSMYIETRGLIQMSDEDLQTEKLNLSKQKDIQVPICLKSVAGLPKNYKFDSKDICRKLHPAVHFYFIMAIEEWQKLQYYLTKIDPRIQNEFSRKFGKKTDLRDYAEICSIFNLIFTPSVDIKTIEKVDRLNMWVDHVYSFGNMMFIFHLLEYLRHACQISEMRLILGPRAKGHIYRMDQWNYLPHFYTKFTSLNLKSNTVLITSRSVDCLKIENGYLFLDSKKNSQTSISQVRFEQAFSQSRKRIMSTAIFREESNNNLILVIYNSQLNEDQEKFANGFLEDMIARLKIGKIPLSPQAEYSA